ncbi:MAG: tetratricopeptide repeat protein, partial [Pyrinomonadaceae bacterium]
MNGNEISSTLTFARKPILQVVAQAFKGGALCATALVVCCLFTSAPAQRRTSRRATTTRRPAATAPQASSSASYVEMAQAAVREGRVAEAATLYDRALGLDAKNFKALDGIVTILVAQKRLGEAHKRVDRALVVQPTSAPLHFLKAHLYGLEPNVQGAEDELRRTIELDANYLPAYFALGTLYINTKRQESAIVEFQRVLARQPGNVGAHTLIGIIEFSRLNYEAAAAAYRQALKTDPDAVVAANNLAWLTAEYGVGSLDEAVRLAQSVVRRFPEEAGFIDTLGWVYYKKGMHQAAIEQLRKAVESNGDNPSYRYHLGMAYLAAGTRAEAQRELEAAQRLSQGKEFAYALKLERALAGLTSGEDETTAQLRVQIESTTNEMERARIARVLADRLVELNRAEEARAELRRLTQTEDFDPVRYYNVGNALARLGDTEGAITAYRKAIAQKRGNYARAQNNLGVVLMRVGRWDEAYEAFTAALRAENFVYAEASYNLGRLHAVRGENDLAIRELRRTLALQSNHVDAGIALARVYAAEGEMERSAATLNSIRTEDEAAKQRIAEARNLIATAATLAADDEGKSLEARSSETRSAETRSVSIARPAVVRASTAAPRLTLDAESHDLLQRARTAREKERYAEAVTLYRRVLAGQNNYFAPANLELGYALVSLKRYEEAMLAFEAVAAKDGARYPIVYYHLGRLYELRGQIEPAAENYGRAATAFGDTNPQFLLDVSRVRERQGNLQAALTAMEAYVQANVKQGRADEWAMTRLA